MISKTLRKIKKSLTLKYRLATGRRTNIKPSVDCTRIWYGNSYGGFYVHPEKLNDQSIVYSFGIGEDISFDLAVIKNHNCRVYGFDPTPKSINWIKSQRLPANFSFNDYGINVESGTVEFSLPINQAHVSGSIVTHSELDHQHKIAVKMKSFEDITTGYEHKYIDLLKMDIEGTEYSVMESILTGSARVGQFAIELHERFFDDGTAKTKQFLEVLSDHGYDVFAVSESLEEISLIKSDKT
jgi:FkbM family methyltransferase